MSYGGGRLIAGLALALALVAVACDRAADPPTTVTTTTTTTVPAAEDVYRAAAPVVAYVESPGGSGSGIVLGAGRLLTAAHVVWPYETVRVVFADGTEVRSAPVTGRDLLGDIALVDISAAGEMPKAVIGDGEEIALGRPVYLVGYPGESDRFPVPTITEGIMSRVRHWEDLDWTFLQSDAAVAGGQSGGALVAEDGSVIGITNFSFTERFGLSASLADAGARVERMESGEDLAGIGSRLPPDGDGSGRADLDFEHAWAQEVFVFEDARYTPVEVSAESAGDLIVELSTIDGYLLATADDTTEGEEFALARTSVPGPHLVVVSTFTAGPHQGSLRSSVDLTRWVDPDDGTVLERDSTIVANVDFPGDVDWFVVDLGRGQSLTAEVAAIAFDPFLSIDAAFAAGFPLADDDDSGGGVFGTDPRIVFTADEAGAYLVLVRDPGFTGPGAYYLTID